MHDFGEFALKVADAGDPSDMMAYTTAETAAVDAALKRVRSQAYQADAGKVSKTGDQMSGTLQIRTSGTVNAQMQLGSGARGYWIMEGATDGDFHIAQAHNPALTIQDISHQAEFRSDLTVKGSLLLPAEAGGAGLLNPKFLNISAATGEVHSLLLTDLRQILGLSSSRRFKTGIQPAPSHPDVARLEPSTFRWDDDTVALTGNTRPQYGLIAEDVGEVDPRLATYDAETGQADGLNTGALIAALVHKVQQLEARIHQLEQS